MLASFRKTLTAENKYTSTTGRHRKILSTKRGRRASSAARRVGSVMAANDTPEQRIQAPAGAHTDTECRSTLIALDAAAFPQHNQNITCLKFCRRVPGSLGCLSISRRKQ
jgi:hypothetical protein